MISIEETRKRISAQFFRPGTETVPLSEAAGRYLAAAVKSPADHPAFDMSAVDGYALRHAEKDGSLQVSGEIPAGSLPDRALREGEAMRIFTGAIVPEGADTVVMQEFCTTEGDRLRQADEKLRQGANIRYRGEQIRMGETALPAGQRLDAAAVGFLASIGVKEVETALQPRVYAIVTGNEFAEAPEDLQKGKIFESNMGMLDAALEAEGLRLNAQTVQDDPESLRMALNTARIAHDVILFTGGVSVGDYDFTRSVLEAEGFEVILHGVAQKPGKPMLVARKGNRIAFGLPGNPRAVLICWYEWVRPFLRAMQGHPAPWPEAWMLPLAEGYRQKPGRTVFAAARFAGGKVQIPGGQQSHMLQSFAGANVIAVLTGDRSEFTAGDEIECHWIG